MHSSSYQWQPSTACVPRDMPAKGAPNVVGTPSIVGTPVWVLGHGRVLGVADSDGLEGAVMPPSGVSALIIGAEGLGLSATDGGLRPPPPNSVEPSGIPAGPTVEPGPIDEASGGDAVADAAQVPGALAVMPPPSNCARTDELNLNDRLLVPRPNKMRVLCRQREEGTQLQHLAFLFELFTHPVPLERQPRHAEGRPRRLSGGRPDKS